MEPGKELTFERTYDVPAEIVWQAWTDPDKIKQWWGPENVSIPECSVDLRVGGEMYLVMEAGEAMGPAKGMRWPQRGTFNLVEKPHKLSYSAKAWTEGQEASTSVEQNAELILTEADGKTHMVLKITVTSIGPDAGMAIQGMEWGYNQQFDKLQNYLSQ